MTPSGDRIFHYTSVESLALILESKKIRFTRLDGVDDLREAQNHAGIRFGQYFFVTCWTCDRAESIPQWHMYSRSMEGVRIELPAYPFQEKPLKPPESWVRVQTSGAMHAPLSLEEIFASDYMVVPSFMNRDQFAGPVEYVDDIEERYQKSISRTESDGKVNVRVQRLFDLARLKSREWAFQKEYRFALFVTPSMPVPREGPGATPAMDVQYGASVANALVNGVAPPVRHLDVDLDQAALEQLVVRLGPLCSPGQRLLVEALLEKYAPGAQLEESALQGRIRGRG